MEALVSNVVYVLGLVYSMFSSVVKGFVYFNVKFLLILSGVYSF